MYLAIDVGGTKTLLAAFNQQGVIEAKYKFPTAKNYNRFLEELEKALKKLGEHEWQACCCAVPGQIDRHQGIVLVFGNLPWQNVPLKRDLTKLVGHIPITVENDANIAGLHEALLLDKHYKKVLYLTISTGIGDGIIVDRQIDPTFADSEIGQTIINYHGKLKRWEDVASGRALVERFGKPASELEDPAAWRQFAADLAIGISVLVATLQPQIIIIGGSVGTHFDKYHSALKSELAKHENKMVLMPPIIQAQKPQEAVIYGCFDYLQLNGGSAL